MYMCRAARGASAPCRGRGRGPPRAGFGGPGTAPCGAGAYIYIYSELQQPPGLYGKLFQQPWEQQTSANVFVDTLFPAGNMWRQYCKPLRGLPTGASVRRPTLPRLLRGSCARSGTRRRNSGRPREPVREAVASTRRWTSRATQKDIITEAGGDQRFQIPDFLVEPISQAERLQRAWAKERRPRGNELPECIVGSHIEI